MKKNKLHKWFEIFLLKFCYRIFMNRNVSRSRYISRKDNNWLWYKGESLHYLIKRMEKDYED